MCLEHFKPKHYLKANILCALQLLYRGHAMELLFEALCLKRKGRRFDSRWCRWNCSLTLSFLPQYYIGSDSKKEMSARNISWGVRRPVRWADNLTTFMWSPSRNLGASTSRNSQGLYRDCFTSPLQVDIRGNIGFIALKTPVCPSCMKQYCQQLPRANFSKYLILL